MTGGVAPEAAGALAAEMVWPRMAGACAASAAARHPPSMVAGQDGGAGPQEARAGTSHGRPT